MTKEMELLATRLMMQWNDEGDGYFSIIGQGPVGMVAYVALPENHKFVGEFYDDICNEENDYGPDVNGGLTYSNGNVFGWDYAHFQNRFTPETDVKNALEWFRSQS